MDYFDLDQMQKDHKHVQAQRLPRGAAGVHFRNPAHLLDAANYVKTVWCGIQFLQPPLAMPTEKQR